jgi:hypothetical protein
MKAKIDNVKAKIPDKEDWGPRSRPTLARRHASDQLAASPTNSLQEGPPRQVFASHELPPPDSDWCVGHDTQHEHLHRNAWGMIPRAMQMHQLAVMQTPSPDKNLNAGLFGCAAIKHPLRRAQA